MNLLKGNYYYNGIYGLINMNYNLSYLNVLFILNSYGLLVYEEYCYYNGIIYLLIYLLKGYLL